MQDLVLLDFFWVVKILLIVCVSIVTIVGISVGYINLSIFIESHPAGELVRNFTNRLRKAFRKNIPEEGPLQVESVDNTTKSSEIGQKVKSFMNNPKKVLDLLSAVTLVVYGLQAGSLIMLIVKIVHLRNVMQDTPPAAVVTDGCEGAINDGMNCNQPLNCYVDADNDGYGTGAVIPTYTAACLPGTSAVQGDSNDHNSFVK